MLRKEFKENRLLIIDSVKSKEAVIQIIDHVNQSGQNSLLGRTPFKNHPRFPDMIELYNKKDIGLPQKVVRCVGCNRYKKHGESEISEMVALVAPPAHYVGWEVTALGWNKDQDPEGYKLCKALNCLL